MRILRGVLLPALLVLLSASARAEFAAIQADKLPQDASVLAALDDARQLEPYTASWTSTWNYPVSKGDAAARLENDLAVLERTSKEHPGNVELLLLTGLVARYAYNVDVKGSHEAAVDALAQAEKLAPADVRAPWFRATLQCQTNELMEGGRAFLAIETAHAWDQLPAQFWDDYIFCAAVTNMPAHLLRADDYITKLHAPASHTRDFLADAARKRFDAYDASKQYAAQEVWTAEKEGRDAIFTSTACGVRLQVQGDWQVGQLALKNGVCLAYFSTGPYKATVDSLRPGLVLIAQQAQPNQTLVDFSKKFMASGQFTPDTDAHCPVDTCLAFKAEQPGMYKADGDGHGRILFFAREEPAYPGLIFEAPMGPPVDKNASGPQAFHPTQIERRMPGKLYYLVLLDTAASIEGPAVNDYTFFLQNLSVE
jgi:hypothetical protein